MNRQRHGRIYRAVDLAPTSGQFPSNVGQSRQAFCGARSVDEALQAVGGSARILLLTELFPPAIGGSAVLLQNVYRRLTSAVAVLTTQAHADAPSPLSLLKREDIDGTLRGVRPFRALKQHVRLATSIRRYHRIDPVLVHCARALPEGLPALLASITSKSLRYVSWAYGEEIATARTSGEYSALLALVYRGSSGVLCCSRNTALLVQSIAPQVPTFVVYPGVDTHRFSANLNGLIWRDRLRLHERLVLLSVGRLQRRKGHDLVLQALPHIVRAFPQVHYVIAGDGDERLYLEALCDSLSMREHVTFAGVVPDADLPELYAACDVFVMPNRVEAADFEGFGIVYLEAAAAGKPTIGGRSGGVPEAISDGTTGYLVDGYSAEELANVVCRLFASSEMRAAFGRAGRLRADREFSWQAAADAVDRIHSQLVCA